jgi:hypothetical protein
MLWEKRTVTQISQTCCGVHLCHAAISASCLFQADYNPAPSPTRTRLSVAWIVLGGFRFCDTPPRTSTTWSAARNLTQI